MDDLPGACLPDEPVPPDHPFYVNLTDLRHEN